jgi:hypothetical protein
VLAESSVDDSVDTDCAPSGVTWRLSCPAANALETWELNQFRGTRKIKLTRYFEVEQ